MGDCSSIVFQVDVADILAGTALVLSIIAVILFLVFNRPRRGP